VWWWVVNGNLRPLHPHVWPSTLCVGGWMSPRAGLDRCWKTRHPPEFVLQTVQPVANRSNDYTISTHINKAVDFITFTPNCVQYQSFLNIFPEEGVALSPPTALLFLEVLCVWHSGVQPQKGFLWMLKMTTLLEPTVLFLSIPNWSVNKPKALASIEGQHQHWCEEVERIIVT
jgi:hypothetical protein